MEPLSIASLFDGPWGRAALLLADSALKGVLLLAAAGLATLLMRRASAAARHLAWVLALAGLLALPALGLLLPQWQLPLLPRATFTVNLEPAPAPATGSTPPAAALPKASQTSAPAAAPAPPAAPSSTPQAPAPSGASALTATPPTPPPRPRRALQAPALFVAFWLAGALITLSPLLLGLALVARLRRRARPLNADPTWAALLAELTQALGIFNGNSLRAPRSALRFGKFRIRLLLSPAATMPMAAGLFRPAVLLPAEAQAWDDEKRRVVLLHELAHVRRRDCLTHALGRAALALHWFNPLAWLALSRLRAERERACDDLVLTAGQRPSAYAGHLLQIARATRTGALTAAAAITMARPSQLEGRLLAILDTTRNRRALTRGIIVLGLFILLTLLVPLGALTLRAQSDAPQDQPPPVLTGLGWQSREDLEWNADIHPDQPKVRRFWRPDGREISPGELKISFPEGDSFKNDPSDTRYLTVAFSLHISRLVWQKLEINDPAGVFTSRYGRWGGDQENHGSWWVTQSFTAPSTLTLPRNLDMTLQYAGDEWREHGTVSGGKLGTTDLGDGISVRLIRAEKERLPAVRVEVLDAKGAGRRICHMEYTPTLLGRWQRARMMNGYGEMTGYRSVSGKMAWTFSTPLTLDKIKTIRILTAPVKKASFKASLLPFERTVSPPADDHAMAFVSSNGVKARLLAIARNPRQGAECWAPDGTPLPQVPEGFEKTYGSPIQPEGYVAREFYLELERPRQVESVDVVCAITSSSSSAGGTQGNDRRHILIDRQFSVPAGTQETSVRIGIAAGPWETLASTGPEGGSRSFTRQDRPDSVVFGKAAQAGNNVTVTVDKNIFEMDPKSPAIQFVAVDKSGKRHRYNGGSGGGGLYTLLFSGLKLEQVVRFEYQARDYEWHEFKNVKLNPAPAATPTPKPQIPKGLSLKLTAHTLYQAGEDPAVYLEMPPAPWVLDDTLYRGRNKAQPWPMYVRVNGREYPAGTYLGPGTGQRLHLISGTSSGGGTPARLSFPPGKYRVRYGFRPFHLLPLRSASSLIPGGKPVEVIGLESNEVEFEVVNRLPEGYFKGEYYPEWEGQLARHLEVTFDDRHSAAGDGTPPFLMIQVKPGLPFPLAFDVFAQREGDPARRHIGTLAERANNALSLQSGFRCDGLTWQNADQARWRLILVPSLELAKANPPIRTFYGHEFTTGWLTFNPSPGFKNARDESATPQLRFLSFKPQKAAPTSSPLAWRPEGGPVTDPADRFARGKIPPPELTFNGRLSFWLYYPQFDRQTELNVKLYEADGRKEVAGVSGSFNYSTDHYYLSQFPGWQIITAGVTPEKLPERGLVEFEFTYGKWTAVKNGDFTPDRRGPLPGLPQVTIDDVRTTTEGQTLLALNVKGQDAASYQYDATAGLDTTPNRKLAGKLDYCNLRSTGATSELKLRLAFKAPLDQIRQFHLLQRPRVRSRFENVVLKPAAVPTSATLKKTSGLTTPTPRLQFRLVAKPNERAQAEELPWHDPKNRGERHWVLKAAPLTENDIATASLESDPGGMPLLRISLTFFDDAKDRFTELTGRNIRRQLAIVFDGKVIAAPTIMARIPEGRVTINGNLTRADAETIIKAIGAARARNHRVKTLDRTTSLTAAQAIDQLTARFALLRSKKIRLTYTYTESNWKKGEPPYTEECTLLAWNGAYREEARTSTGKTAVRIYGEFSQPPSAPRPAQWSLSELIRADEQVAKDGREVCYHSYSFINHIDSAFPRQWATLQKGFLENARRMKLIKTGVNFQGRPCVQLGDEYHPQYYAPDLGWACLGEPGEVFSDFKNVDGIAFPMQFTNTYPDGREESYAVHSIELDADFDPALLRLPTPRSGDRIRLMGINVWRPTDNPLVVKIGDTGGGEDAFTWKNPLDPTLRIWLTSALTHWRVNDFAAALDRPYPLPFLYHDKAAAKDVMVWAKYDKDLKAYIKVHEGDTLPASFGPAPWRDLEAETARWMGGMH